MPWRCRAARPCAIRTARPPRLRARAAARTSATIGRNSSWCASASCGLANARIALVVNDEHESSRRGARAWPDRSGRGGLTRSARARSCLVGGRCRDRCPDLLVAHAFRGLVSASARQHSGSGEIFRRGPLRRPFRKVGDLRSSAAGTAPTPLPRKMPTLAQHAEAAAQHRCDRNHPRVSGILAAVASAPRRSHSGQPVDICPCPRHPTGAAYDSVLPCHPFCMRGVRPWVRPRFSWRAAHQSARTRGPRRGVPRSRTAACAQVVDRARGAVSASAGATHRRGAIPSRARPGAAGPQKPVARPRGGRRRVPRRRSGAAAAVRTRRSRLRDHREGRRL